MPTDLGKPFTETQMFVAVSSGRKFFLELMISMRNTCRGPTLGCLLCWHTQKSLFTLWGLEKISEPILKIWTKSIKTKL